MSHLAPITYAGMGVVADGEDVQASGYEFALPDCEPELFAARWIYVNQEAWSGSFEIFPVLNDPLVYPIKYCW